MIMISEHKMRQWRELHKIMTEFMQGQMQMTLDDIKSYAEGCKCSACKSNMEVVNLLKDLEK